MATISTKEFFKKGPVTVSTPASKVVAPPSQSMWGEIGEDIKQTWGDLKTTFGETKSKLGEISAASQAGEQGVGRTIGQSVGTVLGGLSKGFGNVVEGTVKTVLPQKGEEIVKQGITYVAPVLSAIDKAVGSPVGTRVEAYQKLSDVEKRDVDAALGALSAIFDVATLGVGKKGAEVAGKKAIEAGLETGVKGLKGTGGLLKKAGEGAYGLTVPPTEVTAKALMSYDAAQPTLMARIKGAVAVGEKPITEANTAARQGLMGTEYGIGVQAKKAQKDIWDTIVQPKLQEVKGKVNFKDFTAQIEKEILKTPELGRRADLKEALEAFKETYSKVGKISLEKLQEYKEGWAKFLPDKVYKGKPIANAFKEIQDIAAGKAREIIYKNIGANGKQAYIDYGNLMSIIESGAKSISGDLAKKSISRDVWQFVMDKAITPIATVSGNVLYKTGEGLEIIGKKGAKKLRDILEGDKGTPLNLNIPTLNQKIIKKAKDMTKGLSVEDISKKQGFNSPTVGKTADLIQEAKKYKTADEFLKAQQPTKVTFTSAKNKADYMGGHEAPMAEDINAPIWDLTGKYTGNNLYPKDIYSSEASRLYSSGMDYDNQAISILQSIKDKPNAKVTIYRAVPKDVKGEINAGDWVTLTKEYAKDHGESNLGNNYKIVKKEVFARDIFTDANSIQEFGYDPQPRLAPKDTPYDLLSKGYKEGKTDLHSTYQSQLIDIWNKANK